MARNYGCNQPPLTVYDPSGGKAMVVGVQSDGTYGTVVSDDSGNKLLYFGMLPNGTHGIQIRSATGTVLYEVTSEGGMTVPKSMIPIQFGSPNTVHPLRLSGTSTGFRPGTSTTTGFDAIWQALWIATGSQVDYSIFVYPNTVTMDWRITVNEVGGTNTVVVGPTSETVNTSRAGTFAIPAACLLTGNSDPLGKFMYIAFEAKMTSGASPSTVDILMAATPFNHP